MQSHEQQQQHVDECGGAAACPLAGRGERYVVESSDAAAAAGSGIDRRAFLTRSMLAAAAVALAACMGGGGDAATAPTTVSASIKVSDYAALANVGGVAVVSASGSPVAVVRTGASTFEALSLICPHEGAIVGKSSTGFTCPRHGAQFDANGNWIGGQRTSSMRSYATSYDAGTGVLTIG